MAIIANVNNKADQDGYDLGVGHEQTPGVFAANDATCSIDIHSGLMTDCPLTGKLAICHAQLKVCKIQHVKATWSAHCQHPCTSTTFRTKH